MLQIHPNSSWSVNKTHPVNAWEKIKKHTNRWNRKKSPEKSGSMPNIMKHESTVFINGIPKDMGMVWEAYHKGVPLLGIPGFTLDFVCSIFWFSDVFKTWMPVSKKNLRFAKHLWHISDAQLFSGHGTPRKFNSATENSYVWKDTFSKHHLLVSMLNFGGVI